MAATLSSVLAQFEQIADLGERKTQMLGVLNEADAADIAESVDSIAGRATAGRLEQANAFIEPDSLDIDVGLRRQCSDFQSAI